MKLILSHAEITEAIEEWLKKRMNFNSFYCEQEEVAIRIQVKEKDDRKTDS